MTAIKRYSITLTILVLLVMFAASIIGCGGDGDETEADQAGQLPVINVGDRWEYKNTEEGIEYHLIMEVVEDDDVDELYIIRMTIDPPLEGMIEEATAGFDKELMQPLWTKMSGETDGTAFTAQTDATYEITEVLKCDG